MEMVANAVKRSKTENGMDGSVHWAPCVTQMQKEKVLKFNETGKDEGVTIAAQGALSKGSACKDGFFVAPTLLVDVKKDSTFDQEEIFGPVITVTRFHTEDEVVDIASGTRSGFTAIVYSQENERSLRVCRRTESGMAWLDNYRR